jgi:large subunit ribosomal protein L22
MTSKYMPVNLNRQQAAKAMGKDLPISPKVSIEICNFLRHKELDQAIKILHRVEQKVQAIPYKRFANAAGHKPGMAAGRYPVKAAGEFLKLLENAKANAANQGLTGTLKITHIAAQRASEPMRNRAKERISFKRAHVEVIVTEDKSEKKEKKKAAKAAEHKPVEHKAEHKPKKTEVEAQVAA